MTYERYTAAPISEVLQRAEAILMARLPIEKTRSDAHSLTLEGGDGTVTFEAHRHGTETVVQARTDQLRTSRLDNDVQYFMQLLPYQPGDRKWREGIQPGALSEHRT
jgi:hypothetical protein